MRADTTQLLTAARTGDRASFDILFARLYDELRLIAEQRLRQYRPGATLNTTGLVHEAYVKLVDPAIATANDRAHFFALASRAMRFVLLDRARARQAQKRGGGGVAMTLNDAAAAAEERSSDLLELERALEALRSRSERQGQLVEYRFFGGLSYDEISEVTGLSVRTVKRDWVRARAWLFTYLQAANP
jgi:RNA polymerase sigma factor (TIGR02999 family)